MNKLFLFLIVLSVFFGCGNPKNENTKLMKDEFWGKGEDSDIPWAWVSVCVNSENKCGSTHFEIDDESVSVNYTQYKSPDEAVRELDNLKSSSLKLYEEGNVKNQKGDIVGRKIIVWREFENEKYYALIWTRGSRFTEFIGESWNSIKLYEKDRKL